MARKSSFIRMGSGILKPKEGEGKATEPDPMQEKEDKKQGGVKNWLIGLPLVAALVLCVALCVVSAIFYFDTVRTEALLEIRNQISSLKIEAERAGKRGEYASAKRSLLSALDKCREYSAIRSDSFVAAETQDIEDALKSPAILRGEPGAREERAQIFDSVVRDLPPSEIIARLKDKLQSVVADYLRSLADEEVEKLLSQRLSAILWQFIQSKSEEEIRKALGARLEDISRNRIKEMTVETVISLLREKTDELTRRHLERISQDSERLEKVLGNIRESIVREYLDKQPKGEVAKLLGARIEEIEEAVKQLVASRRAIVTLKDGKKLSGQVLEEQPGSVKFKTDDGQLLVIPREEIDKIERSPQKVEPPKPQPKEEPPKEEPPKEENLPKD
jgi:transcriptional regulator of met regulon